MRDLQTFRPIKTRIVTKLYYKKMANSKMRGHGAKYVSDSDRESCMLLVLFSKPLAFGMFLQEVPRNRLAT